MTQVAQPGDVAGRDLEKVRLELIERSAGLFPLLRKNAAAADRDRRLPQENIEALQDAGIFRLWSPRRYGGFETDMRTQIDVAAELSKACGSTGWVVSLITACSWLVSHYPEEAQDEVFGADPDARVCGVLSPGGLAKQAPGGYIIDGSFPFPTGSLHTSWATLTCPMVNDNGDVVNVGNMLVPMTDVTVKDTWFTVGMRGTGSNTIVAENVFVPQHRIWPLLGPTGAMDGPNLNPHKEETLYSVSLGTLASLAEIGCPLGLARAGLAAALEQLPNRSIAYSVYQQQVESTATQLEVAEAASKIDAAQLMAYRGATDTDEAAARGVELDVQTRVRVRTDCGWATRTFREAADVIMLMCGASSMAEVNYLSQVYRDIMTVTLHALLRPSLMMEMYGRTLCGLEPKVTPVL